jgi:hypothetical protein
MTPVSVLEQSMVEKLETDGSLFVFRIKRRPWGLLGGILLTLAGLLTVLNPDVYSDTPMLLKTNLIVGVFGVLQIVLFFAFEYKNWNKPVFVLNEKGIGLFANKRPYLIGWPQIISIDIFGVNLAGAQLVLELSDGTRLRCWPGFGQDAFSKILPIIARQISPERWSEKSRDALNKIGE